MNYSTRIGTTGDLRAVQFLLEEALSIDPESDYISIKESDLHKYIYEPKNRLYIAFTNEMTIGFITLETYSNHIYIRDISVTAGYRSKGVGTSLITKAEEFAKSIEQHKLMLYVLPKNTRAIKLYSSLGFRKTGQDNRWDVMVKGV